MSRRHKPLQVQDARRQPLCVCGRRVDTPAGRAPAALRRGKPALYQTVAVGPGAADRARDGSPIRSNAESGTVRAAILCETRGQ